MDSGLAHVGNADLYYEMAGQGQPVVLIHAGVADCRQWDHEFAWLAGDFQVLRYDLRGYGKSAPIEGEFRHVEDLKALLDQRGLGRPVVLIGCSMGGSMAMDFAPAHPARVKALVMVGSRPSGLPVDLCDDTRGDEADAAFDAGDLERAAELEAQIWVDGVGRTAEQVDPRMRALAVEMNLLALSHAARQLGKRLPDSATPATERLGELRIPMLVVAGAHDLPYVHEAAVYLLERVPSARKVILEGAAHLANMDRPEAFENTVRSFLAEIA
jgi:3-oxoadipate enol-lactonase